MVAQQVAELDARCRAMNAQTRDRFDSDEAFLAHAESIMPFLYPRGRSTAPVVPPAGATLRLDIRGPEYDQRSNEADEDTDLAEVIVEKTLRKVHNAVTAGLAQGVTQLEFKEVLVAGMNTLTCLTRRTIPLPVLIC
jgi:hypothetical protein